MLTILLFFIIGQTLNIGVAYWVIWSVYIFLWIISTIFKILKIMIDNN